MSKPSVDIESEIAPLFADAYPPPRLAQITRVDIHQVHYTTDGLRRRSPITGRRLVEVMDERGIEPDGTPLAAMTPDELADRLPVGTYYVQAVDYRNMVLPGGFMLAVGPGTASWNEAERSIRERLSADALVALDATIEQAGEPEHLDTERNQIVMVIPTGAIDALSGLFCKAGVRLLGWRDGGRQIEVMFR